MEVEKSAHILEPIKINQVEYQGMLLVGITLDVVPPPHNSSILVDVAEDGFTDVWQYRIFTGRNCLVFFSGNFWVKYFFPMQVQKNICNFVTDLQRNRWGRSKY